MKHIFTLLATLLLAPLAAWSADTPQKETGLGYAVASRLEEFSGEPLFVPMQQLWEKRGGWGGILTAKDGAVVAFQSPGGGTCRRKVERGPRARLHRQTRTSTVPSVPFDDGQDGRPSRDFR